MEVLKNRNELLKLKAKKRNIEKVKNILDKKTKILMREKEENKIELNKEKVEKKINEIFIEGKLSKVIEELKKNYKTRFVEEKLMGLRFLQIKIEGKNEKYKEIDEFIRNLEKYINLEIKNQVLDKEILKNKRITNVLEEKIIPEIEKEIKEIDEILEERDREDKVRLIKIFGQ